MPKLISCDFLMPVRIHYEDCSLICYIDCVNKKVYNSLGEELDDKLFEEIQNSQSHPVVDISNITKLANDIMGQKDHIISRAHKVSSESKNKIKEEDGRSIET